MRTLCAPPASAAMLPTASPQWNALHAKRARKKYVGIFGFASTKYLNEDSQTLGNKKPSLHRKAAELQPRPPRGTSGRVQAVLLDRCRIDLRSVDWKIDIMGVREWLLELSNTSDDQPNHFLRAGGTGSWTQICGCGRKRNNFPFIIFQDR
jgi:hypothetical protein